MAIDMVRLAAAFAICQSPNRLSQKIRFVPIPSGDSRKKKKRKRQHKKKNKELDSFIYLSMPCCYSLNSHDQSHGQKKKTFSLAG